MYGGGRIQELKKWLLFEKMERPCPAVPALKEQKFFAELFFKKSDLFLMNPDARANSP
jgi:hypothetical protein